MRPDAKIWVTDFPVHDRLVNYTKAAYEQKMMQPQLTYRPDGQAEVDTTFRHSFTAFIPVDLFDDPSLDILPHVKEYAKQNFNLDSSIDEVSMTTFEVMAYPPGVGIGMHHDDSAYVDGKLIASDPYRGITAILYLNDEFEGGEIYFRDQNVLIKPSRGKLVIFPSNKFFKHEVKPITSGLRLSYQRLYAIWHGCCNLMAEET